MKSIVSYVHDSHLEFIQKWGSPHTFQPLLLLTLKRIGPIATYIFCASMSTYRFKQCLWYARNIVVQVLMMHPYDRNSILYGDTWRARLWIWDYVRRDQRSFLLKCKKRYSVTHWICGNLELAFVRLKLLTYSNTSILKDECVRVND